MNLKKSIAFLKDLEAHNSKEWMGANKNVYLEAKEEFLETVAEVIKRVSIFDLSITGQEPKKCIFRINRDIRFSKDKRPYKNNFGMSLSEGGKKSGNPVYYFHLQPGGETMIAGGIYQPEPESLKKIRQEIDYNPHDLKTIIDQPAFKKEFGVLAGEALKTAPKGYPKDHPNIELLKHKSFIVFTKLSDKKAVSEDLIDQVSNTFELIYPLNQYLSVAVS